MSRPAHSQTLPAFSAGFRACLDGKALADNPCHTKPMQDAWIRGFKEAERHMAQFASVMK